MGFQLKTINSHIGLRGLAATAVTYGHYTAVFAPALFLPFTHLAVDFFFMLSGFILTLIHGERMAHALRPLHYLRFMIRRIARIYPLHIATLVLELVLLRFQLSSDDRVMLLPNLLMLQAWGISDEFILNSPSWSISCEFAAYLLFPFLAWLLWRAGGWVVLLGLSLLGLVATVAVAGGALDVADMGARLVWLRTVVAFPAGMLLARLWQRYPPQPAMAGGLQAAAIGIMALVPILGLAEVWFLLPLAVLVYATAGDRGPVARLAASRPMVWLGDISYGIYLLQWPAMHALFSIRPKLELLGVWSPGDAGLELAALAIFLICVFGGAALSHRWFERPFIRLGALPASGVGGSALRSGAGGVWSPSHDFRSPHDSGRRPPYSPRHRP